MYTKYNYTYMSMIEILCFYMSFIQIYLGKDLFLCGKIDYFR